MLEGIEGERGTGYSKKEAQQLAAKDTLQRLKREPQFVEAVFQSKTERTKMEEEPAMAVPDTEQEQNFIIEQQPAESPAEEPVNPAPKRVRKSKQTNEPSNEEVPLDDEFLAKRSDLVDYDLSDITHKEKSREEIIAEAEAAAFAED
jgi:ribonuclease-3